MGDSNTAEVLETTTADEIVESVNDPEELEQGESEEGAEQDVELEVVLEGADGSQPITQSKLDGIVSKRTRKLNARNEATQTEATATTEKLTTANQKIALLEMALDQQEQVAFDNPPNPNDYDDGTADPKYAEATHSWVQKVVTGEIQKQSATAPVPEAPVDHDLQHAQKRYCEKAEELGAKGFDESEDRVIAAVGKDVMNHLITTMQNPTLAVAFLGAERNSGKLEELTEILRSGPRGALKFAVELGRLDATLKTKPRAKTQTTPDPDEELEGVTPSAGKSNKHQRAVDAAREKARESGDMTPVLAAKKAAKEAGVNIV